MFNILAQKYDFFYPDFLFLRGAEGESVEMGVGERLGVTGEGEGVDWLVVGGNN